MQFISSSHFVYYYHRGCKTLYSTGKAHFLFVSQCRPSCLHPLAESVWWLDLDFLSLIPFPYGMWDGSEIIEHAHAHLLQVTSPIDRGVKSSSVSTAHMQGTYFVVDLWLPFAASKNISAFSNFSFYSITGITNKSTSLLLAADASGVSECWWLFEGRAT